MLRRVLVAALLAGALAGLAATLAHWWQVVPLLRAAELFEAAAPHAEETAPALRALLTVATNLLAGVGFGLLLGAAFTLYRRPVDARQGAIWGVGGFLAFALLPALGLPPELPGMAAADLGARQLWWLFVTTASLAGLAALAFGPALGWRAAGVALLALPHLIGAPVAPETASAVPAELAARFAAASLAASALFWLVLGTAAGHLLRPAA